MIDYCKHKKDDKRCIRKSDNKKFKHFKLAEKYFKHLGERTKIKDDKERKQFAFHI